jgi:hypothetical protein
MSSDSTTKSADISASSANDTSIKSDAAGEIEGAPRAAGRSTWAVPRTQEEFDQFIARNFDLAAIRAAHESGDVAALEAALAKTPVRLAAAPPLASRAAESPIVPAESRPFKTASVETPAVETHPFETPPFEIPFETTALESATESFFESSIKSLVASAVESRIQPHVESSVESPVESRAEPRVEPVMIDSLSSEAGDVKSGDVFDPPLSKRQQQALELLQGGNTVTFAANLTGVTRATIHRWLKHDPAFMAAYQQSQEEHHRDTRARLLALARKAASAVEMALEKGDAKTGMQLLKTLGILRPEPECSTDPEEIRSRLKLATRRRQLDLREEEAELSEDGLLLDLGIVGAGRRRAKR